MNDDRYDLSKMLRNGHIVRPKSGMVCPRCGIEPQLAEDGRPENSFWINIEEDGIRRTSPIFHGPCVTKAMVEQQVDYLTEHVGAWVTREEYDRRKNASSGTTGPE